MGGKKPVTVYQGGSCDAIPTISYISQKCNEGAMYFSEYEDLAPASGLTTYIHFKTGAKDLHLSQVIIALGGVLSCQWYKVPELGTVGTVISIYNRNAHYSDDDTETKIYLNSTVVTVGTVLFGPKRTVLAGATNQAIVIEGIESSVKRILLPDTDYLVAYTVEAADMKFTVEYTMYEECCV